jgi:hypothetical protein
VVSVINVSVEGGLAYVAGWCLASCFTALVSVFRGHGDPSKPDEAEFFLRTAGGCAFAFVPAIAFAVGAVVGNFWPWNLHLAAWWASAIGAVQFVLVSVVSALLEEDTRAGIWLWTCLWLIFLFAVPGVTGILVASAPR